MRKPLGPLPGWWPRCSGCGRDVERMAWTFDPAAPERVGFRASCHGKTATTMAPREKAMTGVMLISVGHGR